jgi:hypothetical protein
MKKTKKSKPETNIQAILINTDTTFTALGIKCGKSTIFEKCISGSRFLGRKRRRICRAEDTFIYE